MSTQTFCTSLGTFKALSLLILATVALFQVSSSLEVDFEQVNQYSGLLNNYAVLDTGYNTQKTRFSALIGYNGESTSYVNATNSIVKYLELTLIFQNPSQFQIKIVDANTSRWEIPNEAPFPYSDPAFAIPIDAGLANVEIKSNPFAIRVIRKSTGEVIFDTSLGNFMYSDYYLEIATKIPTPYIYGLGERGFNMTLGPNGIYTIWAADYNQNVEDGKGGHNSYGTHPVYMSKEKSGNWNMVLLRNLNAMDCIIANSASLTYKVTGGVFDFNFFLGDSSPETVITSYHKYLGGWTMPPFWSMGYQQSRWGYNNLQDFQELVDNFTQYNIPVDVLWSDIDYMADYVDFTIDEERFPLKEFNQLLETSGKRWVPIIDAGIGVVAEEVYQKGADMDVYVKAPNGTYVTGYVWPGGTVWIDWFHPNASRFWEEGLEEVHQKVPFSGLWLDMNEISNLVDGEIDFMPNISDIRNALPYTPGNPLYTDTIRLDAVHYNGETDFNTHNLYHFMECNITYNYLKTENKLPFILTRANTFGTGKYAFHWTGDNNSSWTMLQLSIPAIMNFNIFGMPMTGSDICGFKKNTTEELCARWMQLGLLYPFSRNHAENDTIHQEPWSFDDTLLETSKIAIDTKYALLKYYYSLFIEKNGYGTIFRPLFFEFPEDTNAMNPSESVVDRQFLLGKGLMASPVVEQGVTEVDVYFPGDRWFDFFTGEVMHNQYSHGMIYQDYPAPFNATVPLFLRGGHIVHTQSTKKVMRSDDLDNNFTLTIGLKETVSDSFQASGKIMAVSDYSENNIYEKCMEENCLLDIEATAKTTSTKCETKITFNADGLKSSLDKIGIGAVQIYGCFSDNYPNSEIPWILNQAYLNGQPVGKSLQRGSSANVFEINFSENDQPVLVKSGDTITIVSQYMNN